MSQFLVSSVTYVEPVQSKNTLGDMSAATYRYPNDVGSEDKGHYMLFNIFVQKLSKIASTPGMTKSGLNTLGQSRIDEGTVNGALGLQALGNVTREISDNKSLQQIAQGLSKIGNALLSKTPNAVQKGVNGVISEGGKMVQGVWTDLTNQDPASFNNNVAQLTDNIAIYMPDTVAFTSQAIYETPELSGDALTLASVGKSLYDNYNGSQKAATNAGAFLISAARKQFPNVPILGSNTFNAAFVGKFGVPNPMVEVIYSKPSLRSFTFEYVFNPRSQKEAMQVQKIIDTFIYHQAPEIKDGTGGYFLVPPSVFDISFMYRGKKNPNIPSIVTCVLENINVDFAPGGFHTFETDDQKNPSKGGTGMPVTIRMQLQFKETRYITKQFLSGEKVQSEKSPASALPITPNVPKKKISNAPKESPKIDPILEGLRGIGNIGGNAKFQNNPAQDTGYLGNELQISAATGRYIPKNEIKGIKRNKNVGAE